MKKLRFLSLSQYFYIITALLFIFLACETSTNSNNGNDPNADKINAASPSITLHPQGATYALNETAAALNVDATVSDEGELSYQWYRSATENSGGTPVGTEKSYTPNTVEGGSVWYYAVVTNTNNAVDGNKTNTATSQRARITVLRPIQSLTISGSGKTQYVIGEPLDFSGLILTATFADNSTENLTYLIGPEHITGYNPLIPGTQAVSVSFLGVNSNTVNVTVLTLAQRIEAAPSGSTIFLYGDEVIDSYIRIEKTLTLRGVGSERILSLETSNPIFYIDYPGKLTLDENVTLKGPGSGIHNQYALVVLLNGELVMKDGSKITGNYYGRDALVGDILGSGSGVFLTSRSSSYPTTFTMEGGEISNNITGSGAGVKLHNGQFIMGGGIITNNHAWVTNGDGGGGVFVYNASFIMRGGKITSNSASDNGGGVFGSWSFLTMEGGEISNNTAWSGGGVFATVTFTMTGGEIFGNKAVYSGWNYPHGGGIYVHLPSNFSKTGGTIYGADGGVKANKVVDTDGVTLINQSGHAIYAGDDRYDYRYIDSTVTGNLGIEFNSSGNLISESGNWSD